MNNIQDVLHKWAKSVGYDESDIDEILEALEASDYVTIDCAINEKNWDLVKQVFNRTQANLTESVFGGDLYESQDVIVSMINGLDIIQLYEYYQKIPTSSISTSCMTINEVKTQVYMHGIVEEILSSTQPAQSAVKPLTSVNKVASRPPQATQQMQNQNKPQAQAQPQNQSMQDLMKKQTSLSADQEVEVLGSDGNAQTQNIVSVDVDHNAPQNTKVLTRSSTNPNNTEEHSLDDITLFEKDILRLSGIKER